ncbi:MAG TPA: hypothetical protein VFP53_03965 [Sphingomicrobium sp.]|nr:hypothetical protein [Sphingomicrobium sp.]
MRIFLALPLLLAAGCNVSTEGNSVTMQYDQNTAENTLADVGNTAENIGEAIGNEVDETANKVDNSGITADDGNEAAENTTNQQ